MAGKTTRNYYQQMLDFIKEEGFCILPSNLIELLLKENTQNFELIHILQENLVTTVNNLNATLNNLGSQVLNLDFKMSFKMSQRYLKKDDISVMSQKYLLKVFVTIQKYRTKTISC